MKTFSLERTVQVIITPASSLRRDPCPGVGCQRQGVQLVSRWLQRRPGARWFKAKPNTLNLQTSREKQKKVGIRAQHLGRACLVSSLVFLCRNLTRLSLDAYLDIYIYMYIRNPPSPPPKPAPAAFTRSGLILQC